MKATFVSALLFGAAMAAPAVEKRGVVVEEVVVTEWTTTTVYADAVPTKSAAAFFEFPASWSSIVKSSSASSAAPAPTSQAAVPSTPPAAPPAAPTTTAAPAAAPPAAAPAAPAAPAAGGGPSGTGDITFYSLGLTSCGQTYSDSDAVVALSHLVMNNGGNSNNNPLCGKTITITYNGITKTGKVVDTCEGCAAGNIDLSPSLFQAFAPESAGRVPGVSWYVSG